MEIGIEVCARIVQYISFATVVNMAGTWCRIVYQLIIYYLRARVAWYIIIYWYGWVWLITNIWFSTTIDAPKHLANCIINLKTEREYHDKFIITYSNYLFLLHLLDVVIFVRFSAHESSCFRTKRSLLKEYSLKDEVDVVSLWTVVWNLWCACRLPALTRYHLIV